MNIYVCGNPLVDMDSVPFRILPELKAGLPEVNFRDFDPTENFPEDNPLYIIDTIVGVSGVRVLEDVESFEDAPHFSAHDADLAFHLKWLKKMEKLPKLVIFGVPSEGDLSLITDILVKKIKKSSDPL